MDFLYENGVYLLVVGAAALAVGFIIYAMMTKTKRSNRRVRGNARGSRSPEPAQEDPLQQVSKLRRFREVLKPPRRPLEPGMELPDDLDSPEVQIRKLVGEITHLEFGGEDDGPTPELVQCESESLVVDTGGIPGLPEMLAVPDLPAGPDGSQPSGPGWGETDGREGGEDDDGFLLSSDLMLSSSDEGAEPAGEDTVLDLFRSTEVEEDSTAGELSRELVSVEAGELVLEAERTSQQLRGGW